jgi:putative redox protein
MNNQKITFKNDQGHELAARIQLPADQKASKFALFAHCFTCNKDLTAIRNISRSLTNQGFGVMSFDFTGLGESEGDFSDTDFSSNIGDLIAAANFMGNKYQAPKLLVGHSLGGAAVVFAANKISSAQAVAVIGAPSSPGHVQHIFKDDLDAIEEKGKTEVEISGRTFTIQKEFVEDISEKNMSEALKKLDRSLLILHSPQDKVVNISNAAEIYKTAKHPKSFISLDGADHLLSEKKDSLYVGSVIASWASRYIDADEKQRVKPKKQVAVRIGKDGYTTDITDGRHQLVADEPEDIGGNDYGPSPYDLLLSSLGACTAITLRMYADRKKWDLQELLVHLEHKKDYAEDCKKCDSKDSKIDHIYRFIELSGDLSDDQKDRLIEIAEKCPVHKTLEGKVKVDTQLLDK